MQESYSPESSVESMMQSLESQNAEIYSQRAIFGVLMDAVHSPEYPVFKDPSHILPPSATEHLKSLNMFVRSAIGVVDIHMNSLDSDLASIISFILIYSSSSLYPLANSLLKIRNILHEFISCAIKSLPEDIKQLNKFYEDANALIAVASTRPTRDQEYVETVYEEIKSRYPGFGDRESITKKSFTEQLRKVLSFSQFISDDFGGLSPAHCATASIYPPSPASESPSHTPSSQSPSVPSSNLPKKKTEEGSEVIPLNIFIYENTHLNDLNNFLLNTNRQWNRLVLCSSTQPILLVKNSRNFIRFSSQTS